MIKTYPSISRDPGLFFPGNGKRKKSGIPGNPGTGISREGTLVPIKSLQEKILSWCCYKKENCYEVCWYTGAYWPVGHSGTARSAFCKIGLWRPQRSIQRPGRGAQNILFLGYDKKKILLTASQKRRCMYQMLLTQDYVPSPLTICTGNIHQFTNSQIGGWMNFQ